MKFTDVELNLILGAVDTHECELTEQVDAFDARHEEEMSALRKLTDKIVKELNRREIKKALDHEIGQTEKGAK